MLTNELEHQLNLLFSESYRKAFNIGEQTNNLFPRFDIKKYDPIDKSSRYQEYDIFAWWCGKCRPEPDVIAVMSFDTELNSMSFAWMENIRPVISRGEIIDPGGDEPGEWSLWFPENQFAVEFHNSYLEREKNLMREYGSDITTPLPEEAQRTSVFDPDEYLNCDCRED